MQIKKYEPYFLIVVGLIVYGWLSAAIFFHLTGADVMQSRPWSMITLREYADLKQYWYGLAGGAAPIVVFGLLIFLPKPESLYGDAKWASGLDVKKAGLRGKHGVLVGKFQGRYLVSEEPAHYLVCAPTRSGKGVGIIIPNLLNFDGSAIVYDIKLENWEKTAGFRAAYGHKVFLWAPMHPDGTTHSYNPLDMIRDDPLFRITDVQNLAAMLIPLPKKDPIWDQLARYTFAGMALYILDRAREEGAPATIGEIYRTLNNHADLRDWALEAAEASWLDPEAGRLLRSFAGMTDKERSFVKTSMAKALNLWSNPLVDAATSRSDFNLRDLRRTRMAIYVGVTVDTRDALGPVVGLFFQQAMAALTQKEPGEDEPLKVLLLMDEFASMGRMELIANAVTMIASYGGRLMFVLQALSTLDEHYGKEGREVILQNCMYQVFFAASDETTTNYVVKRLGKKTVKTTSRTLNKGGVSKSTSQQGRDLMLPQEFQQLDRAKQVVLVESARPVLAKKIRYYEDDAFTSRLLTPPPVPRIEVASSRRVMPVMEAPRPETASDAAMAFAAGDTPPTPHAQPRQEPPAPPRPQPATQPSDPQSSGAEDANALLADALAEAAAGPPAQAPADSDPVGVEITQDLKNGFEALRAIEEIMDPDEAETFDTLAPSFWSG